MLEAENPIEQIPNPEQPKVPGNVEVQKTPAPEQVPQTPAPVQPAPQAQPAAPVQPAQPNAAVPVAQNEDMEASESNEMDKKWVGAVETVIEQDKNKPYEEEEDSHKLSIKYLLKRFGKKIKGE